MRSSRVVLSSVVAALIGFGALLALWSPTVSVADGTPSPDAGPTVNVAAATPSPHAGPTADGVLFEMPVVPGTPLDQHDALLVGVKQFSIAPNVNVPFHDHWGSSILVVSSGQICIAQISLGTQASVTVVRNPATTLPADTVCDPFNLSCGDPLHEEEEATPCDYKEGCSSICSIEAGQMFWLGPKDRVVQTDSTEHIIQNAGPDDAHLINMLLSYRTDESGCAGDCF